MSMNSEYNYFQTLLSTFKSTSKLRTILETYQMHKSLADSLYVVILSLEQYFYNTIRKVMWGFSSVKIDSYTPAPPRISVFPKLLVSSNKSNL